MAESIIQKLYKGKVEVKFFPESHIYMVEGKRKTGVTTYIGIKDKSGGLIPWAVDLAVDYLKENVGSLTDNHFEEARKQHRIKKETAASIGDEVHTWVEGYIKGDKPLMPESREAQIGVNAFLDWIKENKVKFLSSERVLYSKKHDYVGKMDIEAKVNGELCLIDIKTSKDLRNDYHMQTAAYVKADEEESGRKYAGRWLIRVAKETEHEFNKRMVEKGKTDQVYQVFEAKFLDNEKDSMDKDFKAFIACKTLHEWNKATDYFLNSRK